MFFLLISLGLRVDSESAVQLLPAEWTTKPCQSCWLIVKPPAEQHLVSWVLLNCLPSDSVWWLSFGHSPASWMWAAKPGWRAPEQLCSFLLCSLTLQLSLRGALPRFLLFLGFTRGEGQRRAVALQWGNHGNRQENSLWATLWWVSRPFTSRSSGDAFARKWNKGNSQPHTPPEKVFTQGMLQMFLCCPFGRHDVLVVAWDFGSALHIASRTVHELSAGKSQGWLSLWHRKDRIKKELLTHLSYPSVCIYLFSAVFLALAAKTLLTKATSLHAVNYWLPVG